MGSIPPQGSVTTAPPGARRPGPSSTGTGETIPRRPGAGLPSSSWNGGESLASRRPHHPRHRPLGAAARSARRRSPGTASRSGPPSRFGARCHVSRPSSWQSRVADRGGLRPRRQRCRTRLTGPNPGAEGGRMTTTSTRPSLQPPEDVGELVDSVVIRRPAADAKVVTTPGAPASGTGSTAPPRR